MTSKARFWKLCEHIPFGARDVLNYFIGFASVVIWLFVVHRSLVPPRPLFDLERFFPLMRFLVKRGCLVAFILGAVIYKEQKTKKKFEWIFVGLLSLNLVPVIFRLTPEDCKVFIPLFRVLLPWLVAVYMFFWMLPGKLDVVIRRCSTRKSIPVVIFLGLFFFYMAVGFSIFNAKGMKAGDEVHYMTMTRSLVEDRDIDLVNNYENFAWSKSFFARHHLMMNSQAGKAYSFHPFGISVILAPSYFLAGDRGVIVFLAFLSAFIGPLLFQILRRETDDNLLRIAVTVLFSVPLPFCIYAIRPYPEFLAAISALVGYSVIICRKKNSPIVYVLAGCVMGYLSWLLVRRFMIPLVIIDVAAVIRFKKERNLRGAAFFFLPQIAFIASLFAIDFYRFSCNGVLASEFVKREGINFGARTVSISKLTQRVFQMSFKKLEPCLAIFFDKRSGLLWTNAFVVFMMPALLVALVTRFKENWHSLLIVWGHIFLVGAMGLSGWDAGVCHQPRYIVPILPFIAIPCVHLMEKGFGSQRLKLGGGIWVSIVLSFVSLFALLRIPYRFDTTFVAFSRLCPTVTDVQFCMPWFRSQFYSSGFIDHHHIWLFAVVLIGVSLLFWSKTRERVNRSSAFLIIAFSAMLMELLTSS